MPRPGHQRRRHRRLLQQVVALALGHRPHVKRLDARLRVRRSAARSAAGSRGSATSNGSRGLSPNGHVPGRAVRRRPARREEHASTVGPTAGDVDTRRHRNRRAGVDSVAEPPGGPKRGVDRRRRSGRHPPPSGAAVARSALAASVEQRERDVASRLRQHLGRGLDDRPAARSRATPSRRAPQRLRGAARPARGSWSRCRPRACRRSRRRHRRPASSRRSSTPLRGRPLRKIGTRWSSFQLGLPCCITSSICGQMIGQISCQHRRPAAPSRRGACPCRNSAGRRRCRTG